MLSKNEPKTYQRKPSPHNRTSHDKPSPQRMSHNKFKKKYESLRSACNEDQIVVMELLLNDGRKIPVTQIKVDSQTVIAYGLNSDEVIITGFAACQLVLSVQEKTDSDYPERVRIGY